jgi:hypothetical protein
MVHTYVLILWVRTLRHILYMSARKSFFINYFAPADHPETTLALCTAQESVLVYQIIIYLGMLTIIYTIPPDTLRFSTAHNAEHLYSYQAYGSPKKILRFQNHNHIFLHYTTHILFCFISTFNLCNNNTLSYVNHGIPHGIFRLIYR